VTDAAGSQRRRQFVIGVILSTIVAGFFAIFLCLWRVVPHWWVGQLSLRTQYALMPASLLDGLLRDYHRVLDNGYSNALHEALIARLRDPGVSSEECGAILRFYCLRVPRSRATRGLFTLGPEWIGAVLDATVGADAEVRRGAVFFMEGLHRGRELYKPMLCREPDGIAQGISKDEMATRAYIAFQIWWSLPEGERTSRTPLGGTALAIGEP
jgi:hypothetical protein